MHCSSFLLLTFEGLKIIHSTLASDLTLELFHPVERHPSCIGPMESYLVWVRLDTKGLEGRYVLISLKDLAGLVEVIDLFIRAILESIEKCRRGLGEQYALAPACGHDSEGDVVDGGGGGERRGRGGDVCGRLVGNEGLKRFRILHQCVSPRVLPGQRLDPLPLALSPFFSLCFSPSPSHLLPIYFTAHPTPFTKLFCR